MSGSSPDSSRSPTRAAFFAVLWLLFLLPAQIEPTHFIHDDSYFYVQVASHVAAGDGSTFHEITPTNGYHPLWMFFCAGAVAVAGGDKLLALHFVAFVQSLLLLGTVLLFGRISRLLGLGSSAPGMAILAAFFLSTALYASEAHLNVFAVSAGVFLLLNSRERSRGLWLAGAALGFAILARLDNIFVVGALILGWLALDREEARRGTMRRGAELLLPIVFLVGIYLLYNVSTFGHAMPISGAIKSTFPRIDGDLGNLSRLGQLVALAAMFSVVFAFVERARPARSWLLAGLGCGVLAHSAYIVLFTDHYTFWSWYYAVGVLNAALLVVVVTDFVRDHAEGVLLRSLVQAVYLLLVACLLLGGLAYGWGKALTPEKIGPVSIPVRLAVCRWPEQLGLWMKENLPPGSGVLAYDWPGALAVHSDLRILPADGLINDFAYNEEMPAIGAEAYLCRSEVRYYYGRQPSEPGSVGPQQELRAVRIGDGWHLLEIEAPLTKESGGTFRVEDANLVARVRDVVDCPEEAPDAAIWRLEFDCEH